MNFVIYAFPTGVDARARQIVVSSLQYARDSANNVANRTYITFAKDVPPSCDINEMCIGSCFLLICELSTI
jgi:hypothetical protein